MKITRIHARVLKGLATRGDAVMNEGIHFFGFLIADVIRDIKTPDAATNSGGKFRDIKDL